MKRARSVLWVVIADGSRARIVTPSGNPSAYETIRAFDSAEARLPAHALGESPPGRSQESATTGRHAIGARSDAHEHAEAAFVSELARALSEANKQDIFDRLFLVAQPRVAAALTRGLPDTVVRKITGRLSKDLTKTPDHQLGPHLEGKLPAP